MAGTARFVWYELMTPDGKAAEVFYTSVVGWKAVLQQGGKPGMPYTLLQVGETAVGGLLEKPKETFPAGMGAHWVGYIGVDDVDAYAGKVKAAGGEVYKQAEDIPGIGRFAVVGDPQGAMFVLFSAAGDQKAPEFAMGTPGTVNWRELHAKDEAKAWEFYSGVFGWAKSTAMDMGAMGVYQIFKAGGVSEDVGAMMAAPNEGHPGWLFYFNVTEIDAAASRIRDGGGKVLGGPMQVPGGSWVVQAADPQGAVFAVVSMKKG